MSLSPAGRPRDPGVDRRVLAAAVARYAELGWAGFSVEAVARAAGVGKAAIYLRWPTKGALLLAALDDGVPMVVDADTGTLRGDLVALARQLLEVQQGVGGQAIRRMGVEYPAIPGVRERWEGQRRAQIAAARAVIRRGIDRGEVAADTSATLLLDTLCGGVSLHVTAAAETSRTDADMDAYPERIVTFLLRAVT